jgi:hypothetical protein
MWILVAREPRPDAPNWPGRRLAAAVDAVVWPVVGLLVTWQTSQPLGLMGPFITALIVLLGVRRLYRALCANHLYWFTTWRWGKVLAAMLLVGGVMKLLAPM